MFAVPKKYWDGSEHTVNFYDEVPRIGSGYRKVVAVVGRKWVHLYSKYTGGSKRIRVSDWNMIVRSER